MIPDKTKLLQMFEKSRTDDPKRNTGWVTHAICVGDTAGKLAQALNEVGENYDVEKVTTLGYLHDIGKMIGDFKDHPINGYHYLRDQGYDEEYCNISLAHHFINNDENCVFCTVPDPVREKELVDFIRTHHFTPEEKLVALSDSMCLYHVMTLEKRIVDVISRHGTNPHTQDRILKMFELKQQIEQKLDRSLYDLFPEVKENL